MADSSSNNNTSSSSNTSSNNINNNKHTSNTSTSIYHIPQFKYLPSIPWLTLQNHFEHLRSLQQKCLHPSTGKPYILSMRFGKNNSWENLGKGITHVAILEFASQEDLDYYLLQDEVHAEFSRQAMPLVEEATVVDITDGVLFGPTPKKPIGLGGVYKGACHCRGCEWEVRVPEGEVLRHVLCHCDTCKRLGGGPYSCNYIVGREDLRVKRGSPSVYTYQGASGKDVRCFFCPNCTSHIYHHQNAMPDKIIVRTLLLEGGNDLPAGGEIFQEGRLKWTEDLKKSLQAVV